MVRLKGICSEERSMISPFQFLMVRLKEAFQKKEVREKIISIPYGSIKSCNIPFLT